MSYLRFLLIENIREVGPIWTSPRASPNVYNKSNLNPNTSVPVYRITPHFFSMNIAGTRFFFL